MGFAALWVYKNANYNITALFSGKLHSDVAPVTSWISMETLNNCWPEIGSVIPDQLKSSPAEDLISHFFGYMFLPAQLKSYNSCSHSEIELSFLTIRTYIKWTIFPAEAEIQRFKDYLLLEQDIDLKKTPNDVSIWNFTRWLKLGEQAPKIPPDLRTALCLTRREQGKAKRFFWMYWLKFSFEKKCLF